MADLEKRYTSRKVREQRAFRAVQVGSLAAVGTVGTAVLALVGVLSWWIPLILLVIAGVAARGFMRTTRR